eukprot:11622287-Prorocentrum_lima.AAC.1
MRQHIVLLSEKLRFECQVYESCGMQQSLENRLLAEQNHQARALIEAVSGQWPSEGTSKSSGEPSENVA